MCNKGVQARELFEKGYNCAQAVLMAFSDETGLSIEQSARLSAPFGGGVGRMRELCGAVSGMLMAYGMVRADSDIDQDKKIAMYANVQDLAAKFKLANNSIICRELLDGVAVKEGKTPEERTVEYYEVRPCSQLVEYAANLLQNELENK